jgi:Na+-driven multidrug efflux pump
LNQLVFLAYNLADAFWLSSYSELSVAVPGQVFPVIMLFNALSMALTAACLSIVSQYIGGKVFEKAVLRLPAFLSVLFIRSSLLNAALNL